MPMMTCVIVQFIKMYLIYSLIVCIDILEQSDEVYTT